MASVQFRLSVMMFLQFFIWGAWMVSVGTYLPSMLGGASWIGWAFATPPIGAMVAPLFVGLIADRYFATEKVLAFLHLVSGALLFATGLQEDPLSLFWVLLLHCLCYMPTLGLTTSISFRNIGDSEKEFPLIRVWGTIGWIVAGIIVGVVLGTDTPGFFYLAGAASILLAGWCLILPHTPPESRGESISDILGLKTLGLMQETSFSVFIACSFLVCIPLAFYYAFTPTFLTQTDAPAPQALMTLGQFSEIFFMAAMPFFIVRLGIKWMLVVGMAAWALRYVFFGAMDFSLSIVGLLLHGICYDFFFVASYIYVGQKAPKDQAASAQSFFNFVTLGVGMFIGSILAQQIVDMYPPILVKAEVYQQGQSQPIEKEMPLPNWRSDAEESLLRYLNPVNAINAVLGTKQEQDQTPHFGENVGQDGLLHPENIPDRWVVPGSGDVEKIVFPGENIRAVFDQIDTNGNGKISREDWRQAQANPWYIIWIWPAVMAGATLLVFTVGFRERVASETVEQAAEEAVSEPIPGPEDPERSHPLSS